MPAPDGSGGARAVTRSVDVEAPPDLVWRLVSDLPRMGRLSPENAGGRWLRGATGPALGARFRGTNRRGWRRWSTSVVVTECEPGRRFAFEVSSFGLAISRWTYEVTPRGAGTTLTESWDYRAGRLMSRLGPVVSGVADRAAFTATSIEQTLAAVQRYAEAEAAGAAGAAGEAATTS